MLWVGTGSGGLKKFDRKKEVFTTYEPIENDPKSLSSNFVAAIFEDSDRTLWLGTNGGGLNKFDKEKETFTSYTTKDGLPGNSVYAILEDDNNCLWLSTNKGLSKFDKKNNFRNYTVRDGLQGDEFNGRVVCKLESGEMFFGGINGLNSFFPGDLKSKERLVPPPIEITAIKKYEPGGKLGRPVLEFNDLELSYKESISIEFAALSFADPQRNMYRYKLEPVSKDWVDLGYKHDVDLINLMPGEYEFRVKGSNSDGSWNEIEKPIKIRVIPPFWATLWFMILVVLFIGSVILYLVSMNVLRKKEINHRKRTQAELKESEERYRSLIETSPDSIILSDTKGRIIMANQQTANILGYVSEQEVLSQKHLNNLIDIKDLKKARRNAEMVLKTGLNRNVEINLRRKDKTIVPVEMSSSLINKDSEEYPQYFLSIIRDIRERKEAERKEKLLIQADKMISLGTLVSGIAHEINNPVASIKMNSEIFAKMWEDVVPVLDRFYKQNKNFKMATLPYEKAKIRLEDLIIGLMESGQRIEKITTDLRNFSRPGESVSREQVDINKIIESSITLTNNIIKKSTGYFSCNLAENLPTFEGNSQRLEQVFINLIQNACQALPDKLKKIDISTIYEKTKKQIVIKVQDEGMGIEKENLKYITDPFFTTKRDKGGTGLGLSISMQIIQEHGGTMSFDSKVGEGTTVTIILPVEKL